MIKTAASAAFATVLVAGLFAVPNLAVAQSSGTTSSGGSSSANSGSSGDKADKSTQENAESADKSKQK